MEYATIMLQLDILGQLTNDLERFILPKNQTIIDINNRELAITDVYRRLLKAIEKLKKIHKAELIDQLDNAYLALPDGAKSVFFLQKVRKLGDRLISLRINMLEAEPLIEDFCKGWIMSNDEQVKELNLIRALSTYKVKKYENPKGGPFHPDQYPKALPGAFKCVDSKGVNRILSSNATEPVTLFYTPSAEDVAALIAMQSTLKLIFAIEPYVETHRILGYSPPRSIRRAIQHIYSLNYMLYAPTDILIDFICKTASARKEVFDSHLDVIQDIDYKHPNKTTIPAKLKDVNDLQYST
jgi:hypothetical protein